jgi:Kef-type K+ transport system membrane component KefB
VGLFSCFYVVLGICRTIGHAPSGADIFLPVGFIAIQLAGVDRQVFQKDWDAFWRFLAGAALGGNGQEKNEAHDVISYFVLSFFAPIYFVSMGMTTNFISNFNLSMVVIITGAAFLSKIGAVLLGAKLAGMRIDRETLAISFGLNARGATGIILASIGLANHIIDNEIYVAIVLMAIITSIVSGPAIKTLLKSQQAIEVHDPYPIVPHDS